MSYHRVADADSLWPGEMTGLVVGDLKILLVNVEGSIFAYEDRCAHQGVALSKGKLERGSAALTCSAHGWQYDLRTGIGINPKGVALRPLLTKIESGGIWVETDVDERWCRQ